MRRDVGRAARLLRKAADTVEGSFQEEYMPGDEELAYELGRRILEILIEAGYETRERYGIDFIPDHGRLVAFFEAKPSIMRWYGDAILGGDVKTAVRVMKMFYKAFDEGEF